MTSPEPASRYGMPWERNELTLAFDLYCRLPFQKTKASNPSVRELAFLLNRSPASLARKLGNFGAFDPELRSRNISGLGHGSKLDQQIWEEFNDNWNELVLSAHELRQAVESRIAPESDEMPKGPSETTRLAKHRIHQEFFRQAVLSGYGSQCCITGLPLEQCLIASHIVPWRTSAALRTDPRNGLCLAATFDRLFDRGMLTILPDLTIHLTASLLKDSRSAVVDTVHYLHKRQIERPNRFAPDPAHLAWHNKYVFQDAIGN